MGFTIMQHIEVDISQIYIIYDTVWNIIYILYLNKYSFIINVAKFLYYKLLHNILNI